MKLAFIGGYGHHYSKGLLREPDRGGVDLPVAFASDGVDTARSKQVADSLKVQVEFFDDGRAMIDRFKPNLVSVGAVYGFNGDCAADALERGCAVVSDKPIAASWDQLKRLREITDKKGVKPLITEFDFRAKPEFMAARDAVERGEVGDVVLATGQKSYKFGTRPPWYSDRSKYPGTLMWVLSHAIDAIPYATGLKYSRVVGHGGNVSHHELGNFEDHIAVLFEMSNGASALAHADFLRPAAADTHGDDRIRIAGSRGVVEVRAGRCMLVTSDRGEQDITDRFKDAKPVYRAMVDAALGKDQSIYSTSESLATAETLLKARDATDRCEWVRM
jgi:predicted dehydrogenase